MSDSPCPIDLRQLAAEHGYRHGWDPSYDTFNVPYDKQDTWYVRVIGRHGDIWPHSPSSGLLGVFLSGRRKAGQLARVILALPGAAVYTDGDDGMMLTFPVEHFARVAEVIHAYRKPQYTPEQREAMVERGRELARRVHDKIGGFDRAGQGEQATGETTPSAEEMPRQEQP
jgi:hypothetical protein